MVNDVESALAAVRPARPPDGLRGRVLEAAAASRRRARSGVVLRWAAAVLVATIAWSRVQEDRTAERMARAAAAASGVTIEQAPQMGVLAHALLNPRMPMPLPPGYPSTRAHLRLLSIDPLGLSPNALELRPKATPAARHVPAAHFNYVRVRPCSSVFVCAAAPVSHNNKETADAIT